MKNSVYVVRCLSPSDDFRAVLPDDNGRNPFFKNLYKSVYPQIRIPTNPYKKLISFKIHIKIRIFSVFYMFV